MKAHKFSLAWIAFSMGIMAPGGMVLAAVKASEDRPLVVDKSLLLAIDEIRLAEPAKTKAESKASSLPDNWESAWGAIVNAIETPKDKPRTAVERAVLGHALLALNRNAESLHCFVSLENNVDQDAWLVWTKAFLDEKPNSTIALYFHIDALARSADDSNNGQAAKGKMDEWYEAFNNKKSKDVSASEIMLMNLAGNLGDYSAAIYLFQTANYYAPWLADSHANLGWCHLQKAVYNGTEFEKALAITSNFPLAKLGLSFARRADRSKQQESLRLYQQALADVTVQAILKKENPQLLAQNKSAKGADTPGTGIRENVAEIQLKNNYVQRMVDAGISGNRNELKRTLEEAGNKHGNVFKQGVSHEAYTRIGNQMRDMGVNENAPPMTKDQWNVVNLTKGIGNIANKINDRTFPGFGDTGNNIVNTGYDTLKQIDGMSHARVMLAAEHNRARLEVSKFETAAQSPSNNPAHNATMKILQGDNANRLAPFPGGGPGGDGPGGIQPPGGAKMELEGMFQLMSKSPGFNGLMLKRAVQ